MKKTTHRTGNKEDAEKLVRQILESDFGQKLDKKIVAEVAERVLQSLPKINQKEEAAA